MQAFHTPETFLYCMKEFSGPDELSGQDRQANRNNYNRRARQDDHGHSDGQDGETDKYSDQAFGLANRFEDNMFHSISNRSVKTHSVILQNP